MTTPVRYVRVQAKTNFFSPAVRPTGNIAIVGEVTPQAGASGIIPVNKPTVFSDPDDALDKAPGPLGDAVALAMRQEPGPGTVYAVRAAGTDAADIEESLALLKTLPVQLVVVANTPLEVPAGGTPTDAVVKLADHVKGPFGDGLERMGVAMLGKGDHDPTIITGALNIDRMVYVAHKSGEDVAAAVAGTIGGYEPHVSLLLKKVGVTSDAFTADELITINGSETDTSPPAGSNLNWLVNPALIPGEGVYLGEGYTGANGTTDRRYIDIVRTLDDLTFRLKSSLITVVGDLRISRTGLRALAGQMEAVLEPLRRTEVIEDYEVAIPVLQLFDKPQPTETEKLLMAKARRERLAEALVKITYAGAIHRLTIKLTFE